MAFLVKELAFGLIINMIHLAQRILVRDEVEQSQSQ